MIRPFSRKADPSFVHHADRARDAGEWAAAAALYRRALARDFRNSPLWVQYGHALKESGALRDPAKLAQAETAYRRALLYSPRVADAHLQLGHVLKLQGRIGEAKASYLKALALDRGLAAARDELHALAWEESDGDELKTALASLDGVAVPERRRLSLIEQGDAARDCAQWALAAQYYCAVLEREPSNAAIWVQYGHALKEAGNLEDPAKLAEAEVAYRRALAFAPAVGDTYLQLGHALKLRGKTDEAQSIYLRAAALGPEDPSPLAELSSLGWSQQKLTQLQRMLQGMISTEAIVEPDAATELVTNVATDGINPLQHCLQSGAKEGRDPHPLFDTKFYLEQNPDVAASGMPPLAHYLQSGAKEGRDPHPLFDTKFYLEQNTNVAADGINPLAHYLQSGAKEGRDPNPFFDTDWYLAQHPGALSSGLNPLVHYVTIGEANGANPSPRFDIDWYLRCNLDVARAGVSPLSHFLRSGRKEGREPCRAYGLLGAVTDTEIHCLTKPSLSDEVALFITHSPNGGLKPHVRHYLDSLNRHGIATTLIVAADAPFSDADSDLLSATNGIFVRRNEGYDFAAWAHVLHLHPELFSIKILYLINDSVIGPTNDKLFGDILQKIRDSSADFLGLTDSYECCWHIQSYFWAFKKGALSSATTHKFITSIASFSKKTSVIAEYETQLASALLAANLSCEVIFPQTTQVAINRTLFHWKSLMNSGFPFVKVATIRDNSPGVDISDWRKILAAHGYDVSIADRTLAEAQRPSITNDLSARVGKWPLLSPAPGALDLEGGFDSEFYLAVHPDVAAAGVDPYDHYVKHGRAEGRLARTPALDALDYFASVVSAPETVLVVSHEGVRGGAPILAYTLVKGLLEKYNVIVLFLSPGPMLEACRDAGAVVVGPIGLAGSMPLAELVVKRISDAASIKFAVINTIASRYVLPALAKRYIPTVSLIHEFAAYIRPRGAFREAALWSGEVIFSTEITRDNALTEYPELRGRDYRIIPQGLCIVPREGSTDRDERTYIRRILRPEGFPAEGVVILGAGLVEYRKGVDLFIECAARVLRCAPDLPCHFAWIGRGYNPEDDVAYSVYLADQIRRFGVDGHVFFLNEIFDVAAAYETADLLVLSSRLDPLPGVAIEAMSAGLPVVCFSQTTGIANILNKHGLGEHTVASYLDTDDMAQKVVSLAHSKDLRVRVGEQSSRIARTTFNMVSYLAQIEQTAAQQVKRAGQEQIDVEMIAKSDLPRLDYYVSPGGQDRTREDVIREYVRSWASGIGRRKLFPGFHPGIYAERHGVKNRYGDPLADYLRAGQPEGPWKFPLIGPEDPWRPIPPSIRIALHIHAYHLDVFPEILERLTQNSVRPDLLISVKSKNAQKKMQEQLETYKGGRVEIHLVPDPGRDIGPFLTEFGKTLLNQYDLIGHLHTKTSADLADSSVGKIWVRFLLENVLGGNSAPMADIILSRMAENPNIGLVFPDDPHIIGWDKNNKFVAQYSSAFSLEAFPENLHFPVGLMFWARPTALKTMFDLGLDWQDYPAEPLPYDGSLLHGLERLFGLAASQAGFSIFNTNVPGVTR